MDKQTQEQSAAHSLRLLGTENQPWEGWTESSVKPGLLWPLSVHADTLVTPRAEEAYWKAVIASCSALGLSGSHFWLQASLLPSFYYTSPCSPHLCSNKSEFGCFAAEELSQLWVTVKIQGATEAFGGEQDWGKLSSCRWRYMGCALVSHLSFIVWMKSCFKPNAQEFCSSHIYPFTECSFWRQELIWVSWNSCWCMLPLYL